MDRREALKKIGVGGITVVGASAVMSSPAFANPGTNDDIATAVTPAIQLTKSTAASNVQATIIGSLSVGGTSVTCPFGGAGSTQTLNSSSTTWRRTGPLPASDPQTGQNPVLLDGTAGNGSYTAEVQFLVRCVDRNGLGVCASVVVVFTFKVTANGGTVSAPTIESVGTPVYNSADCTAAAQ